MSKSVLVPLANGFEEIEAMSIIDVLRRAGLKVTTASLAGTEIKGANNVIVKSDDTLDNIKKQDFDAIVLPGGMPGTTNLLESNDLKDLILRHHKASKIVAAICAAPWVLGAAGVLENKRSTIYPGMEDKLPSNTTKEALRVVQDGNIITGQGPAVGIEFALKIVEVMVDKKVSQQLFEGLICRQ